MHVRGNGEACVPAARFPPIVYWNTIHTQRALDELGHEPASDELAGLTPTIFEHVNPLGTYDFSSDQPAGQLRPLRAATAA